MMRINTDDWEKYAEEPTGKQNKKWLIKEDTLYLYKEAGIRDEDQTFVLNDVTECIVYDIANLLKVENAKYLLCKRKGKNGVITPSFLNNRVGCIKEEEFTSGISLINKVDSGFKNTYLENPQTKDLYTVSLYLKSLEEYDLTVPALEQLIFKLLIADRDFNPSNWGIIKNLKSGQFRLAPAFDNGTALAISLGDKRIKKEIIEVDGKPIIINLNHFNEVIHNHIVSKMVLEKHFQQDGKVKWYRTREEQKLPNVAYNYRIMEYQPIIEYLTTFYSEEISDIMYKIGNFINEESISTIINCYSSELDISRSEFSKKIVLERAKWMSSYYENEKQNSWGRLKV